MEITLNVTLLTALFALLFTVIIAFCSVFAGLGFIFRLLLNPVKKDVEGLKHDVGALKQDVEVLKQDVEVLKQGQQENRGMIKEIDKKLDKLLATAIAK